MEAWAEADLRRQAPLEEEGDGVTTMKLPAKIENLEELVQYISAFASEQGFTEEKALQVELVAEEALVNIIHYAYPHKPGDVAVQCSMENDERLVIKFLDTGIPFDIHSLPEPDVTASMEEREIGGLGIFFIHRMVDRVDYRRDGDQNILTFIIHR